MPLSFDRITYNYSRSLMIDIYFMKILSGLTVFLLLLNTFVLEASETSPSTHEVERRVSDFLSDHESDFDLQRECRRPAPKRASYKQFCADFKHLMAPGIFKHLTGLSGL